MTNECLLDKASKDLLHPSRDVRFSALDLLKEIDGDKSIKLLLKALKDQSWHLREKASEILASKGEPAVPYLINALINGIWYVRASAAYSLGKIGDPQGILPLINFWTDENTTVRDHVRQALQEIVEQNDEKSIAAVLYGHKEGVKWILEILNPELRDTVRNLLKNPQEIEELIPRDYPKNLITEEEREKILRCLRKRLNAVEII